MDITQSLTFISNSKHQEIFKNRIIQDGIEHCRYFRKESVHGPGKYTEYNVDVGHQSICKSYKHTWSRSIAGLGPGPALFGETRTFGPDKDAEHC